MGWWNSIAGTFNRVTGNQSNFRRMLDDIASGAGLTLLAPHNDHGGFCVVKSDIRYFVILSSADDVVAEVSIPSPIKFPPNRLPTAVCEALDELNEKLEDRCFGALHHDDSSSFRVKTYIPICHLTPSRFVDTVNDLLESIQKLDRILRRNGYAR